MPDNRFDNALILNSTGLTTTATSSVVRPVNVDNVGLQVTWSGGSGTPSATVTVSASNDGTNFSDLVLSSVPVISGNSGTLLISLNQVAFTAIRATVTMAAGTINVFIRATGAQV